MFHTLNADTANELWVAAAQYFCEGGLSSGQSSRSGETLELMNVGLTLNDPRQRWISARTPAINPAFAIAEVVWIVSGRQDAQMLNYFNPQLPRFAGNSSNYHGAYGYRLRNSFGLDQLERAYEALSSNPDSRQVVLQIWNAESDLPLSDGTPQSEDIPCNVCSLVKVRNGRLEWTQIMRSNDLFRGFPHNVVQFSALQEILAGWLNLELGAYHHFSHSLHFYTRDFNTYHSVGDSSLVKNTDSIAAPKRESDAAFKVLSEFSNFLASSSTNGGEIIHTTTSLVLSKPFYNLAATLASDALRRRGMEHAAEVMISTCGNDCLAEMFRRWMARNE